MFKDVYRNIIYSFKILKIYIGEYLSKNILWLNKCF